MIYVWTVSLLLCWVTFLHGYHFGLHCPNDDDRSAAQGGRVCCASLPHAPMEAIYYKSIYNNYPLVNKQFDPENYQFLMETSLPTPMTARVELLIYWRVLLFILFEIVQCIGKISIYDIWIYMMVGLNSWICTNMRWYENPRTNILPCTCQYEWIQSRSLQYILQTANIVTSIANPS